MYDETITLIQEIKSVDEYGDLQTTTTDRVLFTEVKSIGMSEFYQAQALGFKPEIKFVIADYLDYNNEQKLKYKPYNGIEEVYSIIRTFRADNTLELICKKGVDV